MVSKRNCKDLITEGEFWNLLAQWNGQEGRMFIEESTEEELIGFCYHSVELYRRALTSDLWAAVYVARGGCGDDSFHYFRCWLVKQGKSIYYNALNNPDSLLSVFEKYENVDQILSDSILVEIQDIYYKLKNEDLDIIIEEGYYLEFENKSELEVLNEIEFNWGEDSIESIRKICPRLCEKYADTPLIRKTT